MKKLVLMLALVYGLALSMPMLQSISFAQEDGEGSSEGAAPSGGEGGGEEGGSGGGE